MKILFDSHNPFSLAHGGFQVQIEQTKIALEKIGVDVEWMRWWDESQWGDVLQFFGRPSPRFVEFAQKKEMRLVILDLLSGHGSYSYLRRQVLRLGIRSLRAMLPAGRAAAVTTGAYLTADACIVNTGWESHLMNFIYGVPAARIHVVPNGVEDIFLNSAPEERGQWLVCTATITPRKRILELARAAVAAKTPLWLIGTPYSEAEPYFQEFLNLTQKHAALLRYAGQIRDRGELAAIYRQARGFVLMSTMETRSLSSEEAAACGCPLLLSDLPWAHSVFEKTATYCPVDSPTQQMAGILREFYDNAPALPPPPKPKSWVEVAGLFRDVYQNVLAKNR